MPHPELPPARAYLYERVTIDLGSYAVTYPDGRETPLTGQVAELLALLLEHPGQILRYQYLGLELMPNFAEYRHLGPSSLDPYQLRAIKHAMQSLVHRARAALGERPGSPSLIVNRGSVGYGIRRPHCVLCDPRGARVAPQPVSANGRV